ncbi:MAG: universal stress protein [Anaerolineae bacterium]|nr:MAG: universal stress protein [Anaerolineae bacterium]
MYRKILLPVEPPETTSSFLQHAASLARELGAHLLLLYVITIAQTNEPFFQQVQVEIGSKAYKKREEGQKFLERLKARLDDEGIPTDFHLTTTDKSEAEAITEHALQEGCDLIVLPNEHRGVIGRWLFGNLGEKVRRHAQVPVLFI